jgi:hypothetical protein
VLLVLHLICEGTSWFHPLVSARLAKCSVTLVTLKGQQLGVSARDSVH